MTHLGPDLSDSAGGGAGQRAEPARSRSLGEVQWSAPAGVGSSTGLTGRRAECEYHLSKVFAKLSIGSRVQLAQIHALRPRNAGLRPGKLTGASGRSSILGADIVVEHSYGLAPGHRDCVPPGEPPANPELIQRFSA